MINHHKRPSPLRFLQACAAIVLAPLAAVADGVSEELELLRQNGVVGDTASVLAYLQRLQPDPGLQVEIAAAVDDLADEAFASRLGAFRKLTGYGEAARDLLGKAALSEDPEVSLQSKRLLQLLDSGEQVKLQRALTLAALEVLRSRGEPEASPTILATLGILDDAYARDVGAAALWASVDATQIDTLEPALDDADLSVRAAALVALEIAVGENAVERLTPLLESDHPRLRLAAARALIDRLPTPAVKALVEIAGMEGDELSWKADALLQMKTGHEIRLDGEQTLAGAWKQWAADELATADLRAPIGIARLDPRAGRSTLEETFARDLASLENGYGRFLYEADNGAPARVADGRLRLDGNNAEGDQRLYITSQRMIGSDRWPASLEIRTELQGEAGNNFGWHLGVSVGRVKTLFHPGLRGGAFRAETTDEHLNLFQNEDMSFEPVAGVTHEMIIRVKKTRTGADFHITVNGGKGGDPHEKKFSVSDQQLGDYDRIGLERSGRTGGDALFESLSIRLGR